MDIDQELADLVQYAGRLGRLLTGAGLTRAESAVLSSAAEPRRITELAREVGLTQPRITTLVDALQARGLVDRERDPDDGRAVLVTLTGEGRALVAAQRERLAGALDGHGLDAGEVAATLRVVVDALDQSDSKSRTIPATGIETQSGRLLSS
jgi:DNA-binding MarR family transcriptional regulator